MNRLRTLGLFLLLSSSLAAAGCGDSSTPGPKDGGKDADPMDDGEVPLDDGEMPPPSDSGTDSGVNPDEDNGLTDEPLEWTAEGAVDTAGGVIHQRISYQSHGLKIYGDIFRPDDSAKHPLLVYNHGGFDGLFPQDVNLGKAFAKAPYNYVVIMSEYRGEGGSEGTREVCNGEADDVRRLDAIAREEWADYIDLTKVGTIGFSHGGCITMRALLKGLDVKAAVNVFGLGDLSTNYNFFLTEDMDPLLHIALGDAIAAATAMIRAATGGVPSSADAAVKQAYADRSPSRRAHKFANSTFDFLVVHGRRDFIVPHEPNCRLANGMGDVDAWNINLVNQVVAGAPPDCAGGDITWKTTAAPTTSFGHRTFLVFEAAGHDVTDNGLAPQNHLQKDAAWAFLKQKLQ